MDPQFRKAIIPFVIREVENLKINATPDEIAKLDITTVDGYSKQKCIYGQLTGNCNSDRALELISKCCEKVYVHDGMGQITKLNGHASEVIIGERCQRDYVYLSPIERAITPNFLGKEAAMRIIDYLKGDCSVLKLDTLVYG